MVEEKDKRAFRTYVELVAANELYQSMNGYYVKKYDKTLVQLVADQLKYQWANLRNKLEFQFNRSRIGIFDFYKDLIIQFSKEKKQGMKLLENYIPPQMPQSELVVNPQSINEFLNTIINIEIKNLDDCSDHMRLIGTVIESIDNAAKPYDSTGLRMIGYRYLDIMKSSYRDKDGFSRENRKRKALEKPMSRNEHVEKINGLSMNLVEGWKSEYGQYGAYLWENGDKPSGISSISLLGGSTIKQIDEDFSLPIGADISGTTADALFNLQTFSSEVVGNLQSLAPTVKNCLCPISGNYNLWIYHGTDQEGIKKDIYKIGTIPMSILNLIPVATMVRQYHHTILEVAATMSLVGTMNYSIGKYQSLLSSLLKVEDLDIWGDLHKEIRAKLNKIDSLAITIFDDFKCCDVLGLIKEK